MSVSIRIEHALSPRFRIDASIETKASLVGITGPSGSGKTSILHTLAGIQLADTVRISVFGDRLDERPIAERSVGLAMQNPHLFPHLNVRANLLFGAQKLSDTPDLKSVSDWLEISDLLDRPIRNLSGGERQRVALGRAVLSQPTLLLLDEPFAAVDAERTVRIATALKHHARERGMAMILASHNSSLLNATVEQTFRIHGGCTENQTETADPLTAP